jgi:tyrosyl-tRNA synthetase
VAECDRLGALGGAEINAAKITLANEVTKLCHGAEAAASAEATARAVFEQGGTGEQLPTFTFTADKFPMANTELLVSTQFASSNKQAKRLLAEGSVRLGNATLTDPLGQVTADMLGGGERLSHGRKRHALVRLAG